MYVYNYIKIKIVGANAVVPKVKVQEL